MIVFLIVTGGMNYVCLCLWPNFINSSISFLRQCQLKETSAVKRKWRHARSKSTVVNAVGMYNVQQ